MLCVMTSMITKVESLQQFINVELLQKEDPGHYYIEVEIGNPPKKQALELDTGSSELFVRCG